MIFVVDLYVIYPLNNVSGHAIHSEVCYIVSAAISPCHN